MMMLEGVLVMSDTWHTTWLFFLHVVKWQWQTAVVKYPLSSKELVKSPPRNPRFSLYKLLVCLKNILSWSCLHECSSVCILLKTVTCPVVMMAWPGNGYRAAAFETLIKFKWECREQEVSGMGCYGCGFWWRYVWIYRTAFNAFMICGEQIAGVEDFVYLGSSLNAKGLSAPEIRRRLGMARSAVQRMGTIWRSRGIHVELKVRLLCSIIFPIPTECKRVKSDDKG